MIALPPDWWQRYDQLPATTLGQIVRMLAVHVDPRSERRRRRDTAYFVNTGDVANILAPLQNNATLPEGALAGVDSGYFIVHCRIHSARVNARIDTLIARYGIGNFAWTSVIWVRRLTS